MTKAKIFHQLNSPLDKPSNVWLFLLLYLRKRDWNKDGQTRKRNGIHLKLKKRIDQNRNVLITVRTLYENMNNIFFGQDIIWKYEQDKMKIWTIYFSCNKSVSISASTEFSVSHHINNSYHMLVILSLNHRVRLNFECVCLSKKS